MRGKKHSDANIKNALDIVTATGSMKQAHIATKIPYSEIKKLVKDQAWDELAQINWERRLQLTEEIWEKLGSILTYLTPDKLQAANAKQIMDVFTSLSDTYLKLTQSRHTLNIGGVPADEALDKRINESGGASFTQIIIENRKDRGLEDDQVIDVTDKQNRVDEQRPDPGPVP